MSNNLQANFKSIDAEITSSWAFGESIHDSEFVSFYTFVEKIKSAQQKNTQILPSKPFNGSVQVYYSFKYNDTIVQTEHAFYENIWQGFRETLRMILDGHDNLLPGGMNRIIDRQIKAAENQNPNISALQLVECIPLFNTAVQEAHKRSQDTVKKFSIYRDIRICIYFGNSAGMPYSRVPVQLQDLISQHIKPLIEKPPTQRKKPTPKDFENTLNAVEEESGRFYPTGPVAKSLFKNKCVVLEGVAGCGKSYQINTLSREDTGYGKANITTVVFHPSTSYEEFVSGLRPNFSRQENEPEFVSHEGVFLQACRKAVENPTTPHLLFIDEINRANTSRVFGDLMLVIETSKRVSVKKLQDHREKLYGSVFAADADIPQGFTYATLQTPIYYQGKIYNRLVVPDNLHILGTMNSTDRSVGTIDLALRRRFIWMEMNPHNETDLRTELEAERGAISEELDIVIERYADINAILESEVGPDARLGHSYFFSRNSTPEDIARALLTQLAEIAATFNISSGILEKIGSINGLSVKMVGQRLGSRPRVVGSWSGPGLPSAPKPAGQIPWLEVTGGE